MTWRSGIVPVMYKLMTILNMDTNLPADAATMTTHWQYDGAGTPSAEALLRPKQLFAYFLDGLFTNNILSAAVNHANVQWKLYDMNDPEPRSPVSQGTETPYSTTASIEAPPELSIVCSFQGDVVSGTPQSRRRGRVYVGPLGFLAGSSIPSTQQDHVRDAAQAMLDAVQADANWTWGIYSRVDDAFVEVTNGWVNNNWDIQRRRGLLPTSRLTFS